MNLVDINIKARSIDNEVDVIAHESAAEMMARLDFMMIKPETVLTVGRGLPELNKNVAERYPDAKFVELNSALPQASIDLIVANLALPWERDASAFLDECLSLLRPHGLLIFTTFGLDTMREYQTLFAPEKLLTFLDMHDVGDVLLKMGWEDVVVDVNYYTLTYQAQTKLFAELKATGMIDIAESELADYVASAKDMPQVEKAWPLTYEVIHAHAFAPAVRLQQANSKGEVEVPISSIINLHKSY